MNRTLIEIKALSKQCHCGNDHNDIPIETIMISDDALQQVVIYLQRKRYQTVALIVDQHTFEAAGRQLSALLQGEQIHHTTCFIQPDENGDVIADEASIVQALLEVPHDVDAILAVGSGTIHDITRFCSYKMKVPFISVPTAPSVDGFTSMGAPLIIRGVKKTIQAQAPIAVFADISVLKQAPKQMIAAGFGDMIAKYTSLIDWRFGHLVAGEPYCPLVDKITQESLQECVNNIEKIAAAEEEGVQILMNALLQSGIAMLIMGQSYPASGGEHHLSHYWEMEFLRRKKPQVLHGTKVGVSTSLIAEVYTNHFLILLNDLRENKALLGNKTIELLERNRQKIKEWFGSLPSPSELRLMMERVGGACTPEQLGIDQELVDRSLKEAYHLRDRFTILRFLNEFVK
ncbi:sn-glycerol-1-phosphate dehydrogenase [Saccharococcus caldoxylosilyticus]|uniref:Lycerol-1-phosphate dehydrogenase [NAD(P)+] n=1 Tax=Parageobacillus caldoxylosilyticus NBRC 107762 TaxID=1220594 RepID=A0A023DFH3_9BACL|nr:sn-glycerol-1-phosphate dehydrogenase [Parageobacillus caldoxylosilyticus]MBB3853310.1 glycerol-1-phosphate dehydrogenase [NAD(P)+] [Parageobacillus caldoxylosilyticus]BDG43649.1 glycerol-1-phosphate dehydrogenase [NAD(P)+] [Parageobacillus caldoxylosilyticus]GAJ39963.1 lycerol-1-phosphate dehydrogenase [NAD(P)+] [Parageobacillus caldoxylosilyticus NBRC 107762]